jgi:hypothetical protein
MKTLITVLAALAVSVSFATAADAEKKAGDKPAAGAEKKAAPTAEERFKKLDANSDGKVSLDEMKNSPAGKKDAAKAEEMFKKKDKDSDGNLSAAEFAAGGKKKDK